MTGIDLRDENLEEQCQAFSRLRRKPSFSIAGDTDVNILFFKRKDKYFEVRTGLLTDFETREEFLVCSVLVEEIGANIKTALTLEHLEIQECSNDLLKNIYKIANRVRKHLPPISTVEHSYTILNNSELNWIFLEDGKNYHSLFWNESETRLFSRSA